MQWFEWKSRRKRWRTLKLAPWFVVSALLWFLALMLSERFVTPLRLAGPSRAVEVVAVSPTRWQENRMPTLPGWQKPKNVDSNAAMEPSASDSKRENKPEEKKPDNEEKPKGQIVDIAMPEKEETPDSAKYVSQYDSKVKKETRARVTLPADQVAPKLSAIESKERIEKPSETVMEQLALVTAPEEKKGGKVEAKEDRMLFLIPELKKSLPMELPTGSEGALANRQGGQKEDIKGNADRLKVLFDQAREGREGLPGEGGEERIPRALLPPLAQGGPVSGMGGAPMNDFLDGVEEGDETWLNTRGYKYASFFNRVKRKVSQQWNPIEAQRRYDPNFNIYGYRSRHTVVHIELDQAGNLEKAEVENSCGVDFLDQEAVSAITAAAPFPNPPPGVIEQDGKIKFSFGFFFELTQSGFRVTGRRN